MKLSVRVRGDWFAVPCKGTEKVTWLGEESLRRYYKSKSGVGHALKEKVYEVRKAKGAAILDPDDAIRDVLDENDFVTVVLDSDISSPVTGPAEPVYVEEKMYPSLTFVFF
ncbi:histidine ammonia-lyase-like [Saccostrea cucullata]|uniref:histidine ammonia-lyase-like n=1 Tax=Saccostrea cuccullata TaxID=36930 RepID=UPI002ED2F8FA